MKLKNANLTDQDLEQLFYHFDNNSSIEMFRAFCEDLLIKARVPNQQILRDIKFMSRKQLTFTMTNFILKGQGLGVK